MYFNRIAGVELLTAEEEKVLAHLVKKGDEKARHRMIESNLRLVVAVAKRYNHRDVPLTDLIAEGNLGLIQAVEKFEPKMNFRFSTYAIWWIRHAIEQAIMNTGRIVRLPIYRHKAINRVLKVQRELAVQLNRDATYAEIAKLCQESAKEVEALLLSTETILSLDMKVNDEKGTLMDMLSSENTTDDVLGMMEECSLMDALEKGLSLLDEESKRVIIECFGLEDDHTKTYVEVGALLGMTREKVKRVQVKAIKTIRKYFTSALVN